MKKNKVLYIGHYRESSAWSRAFIGYAEAMESVGLDVCCRAVKLGLPTPELPDSILKMENKSSIGCQYVIQHVLPHHLSYDGRFKKNVAMFPTESTNFTDSGWQHHINLMDTVVVFAKDSVQACRNSGVTIPVKVIPHTVNTDRYKKERKKIDFGNNDFKFLWTGDQSTRKNLSSLLRAFHSEFDPSEPVSLVIKMNSSACSPEELLNEIGRITEKIKKDLRLYPETSTYKPEIIIADYISDDSMMDLYNSVDCLVNTSMGEGWSFPTHDAIGMGKYPLCVNYGGPRGQIGIRQDVGLLLHFTESPCTGEFNTFNGLFTGHSSWCSIDISELMKKMRFAYKNLSQDSFFKRQMVELSKEKVEEYNYENVGNKFLELLEE